VDVLEHLTHEHRKAEELMARLAETDPGSDRDRILGELEEALAIHMAVEEQFLYPIVTEAIGSEDAHEANVEHDLARQGLSTMRELAGQAGFGAALDMLKGGIGHHVTEEEKELFPKLRETAGDEIGQLDPEALEAAAGKTRAELYERAREGEIDGRSSMSKAELADAVAGSPERS
jgi:iron-sulfur cluster repair protein YtfE (RIC family)